MPCRRTIDQPGSAARAARAPAETKKNSGLTRAFPVWLVPARRRGRGRPATAAGRHPRPWGNRVGKNDSTRHARSCRVRSELDREGDRANVASFSRLDEEVDVELGAETRSRSSSRAACSPGRGRPGSRRDASRRESPSSAARASRTGTPPPGFLRSTAAGMKVARRRLISRRSAAAKRHSPSAEDDPVRTPCPIASALFFAGAGSSSDSPTPRRRARGRGRDASRRRFLADEGTSFTAQTLSVRSLPVSSMVRCSWTPVAERGAEPLGPCRLSSTPSTSRTASRS